MRRTLESVSAQTVPPALWVVVDDGSTRRAPRRYSRSMRSSAALSARRAARRPRPADVWAPGSSRRSTPGSRRAPRRVRLRVQARPRPRPSGSLLRAAHGAHGGAIPRIGTSSGKPYFVDPRTGALVPEVCGDEMSVGMTKFYRVACFREIGGFVRQVMWDGIDCHRCRMLGWIAESVDSQSPPLRAPAADGLEPEGHLDRTRRARATGSTSWEPRPSTCWPSRSTGCRSTRWPLGSLAMLWGYFSKRRHAASPRYEDVGSSGPSCGATSTLASCVANGRPPGGSTRSQEPVWRTAHPAGA